MNKILLALTILSAGAGGFLTARQSTAQLQHEAQAIREAWLAQTQLVAVAQSDQAGLSNRVRELRQALAQPQVVGESAVWSALQTNRAGQLTPELRERLLEELGFNWQSSPDFIVVSKEAVRELWLRVIGNKGNVTDIAAIVLTLTPDERGQVEAAMPRVRTDFNEWASAQVERTEPKDDIVAQYSFTGDPAMVLSLSNNFAAGVSEAVGRERADLILPAAANWAIGFMGNYTNSVTMTVKRSLAGNEERLKLQISQGGDYGLTGWIDLWRGPRYSTMLPEVFWAKFPHGWDDVAKREGFELPEEPQKK